MKPRITKRHTPTAPPRLRARAGPSPAATRFKADVLIHADCHFALEQIPDACVDLTVFSPPYDAIRDYDNEWSMDHARLGKQIWRVTREGGVCAVVIGDGTKDFAKSLTTFRWAVNWVDAAGWRLFECCIYSRHGNPGAWWAQRFRVDHEYILVFFKGDRPRWFDKTGLMVPSKHAGKMYTGTDRLTNGGFKRIEPKAVAPVKCRGTIWSYATSNTEGNRTKLEHPATFPDRLANDLIQCFSRPGDVVLDPMMGSGTTVVMAAQAARKFVGIEVNAEYYRVAQRRLRQEVFEPRGMFR